MVGGFMYDGSWQSRRRVRLRRTTLVFLRQVEGAVFVEVATGDKGAQLEDGFGAVQAPPGAL
jgi:hypothetical protein